MHASVHGVLNFGGHAPRFGVLPAHLNQLLFMRLASTASVDSSNGEPSSSTIEYPFPKHAHPTPYEIFHLKPGALPVEIKSRYYQLVRIHHPDAPHARRLPSHVSHARFQAIQAAHDVLTGKMRRRDFPSPSYASSASSASTSTWGNKSHAHRRTHYSHNAHAEWAHAAGEAEETANDRWKDQTIVLAGIAAIGLAVVPFLTTSALSDSKHVSAAQNLAQARREAREVGMSRRVEIRKRVRSQELEREYEERSVLGGNCNGCDGGPAPG